MKNPVLQIHPRDNVAVSLRSLDAGLTVDVAGRSVRLAAAVPPAHKIALRAIRAGEPIIKFGQPIGRATSDVGEGGWVHVQNVRTNLEGVLDYQYAPAIEPLRPIDDGKTFMGYRRPNGEVGIRNEIWIIPTVGCVNEIAQTLARQLNARALPGNITGVHAMSHPYGCSQLGDDHATTQRVLAALAQHPNAAGVLIIGLGCENNTMASFRKLIPEADSPRYRFMVAQEVGDELAAGRKMLDSLIEYAAGFHREKVPVSELRVGLKCGGSDGFSGITANPLVGAFSDQLIARGGTSILTEVPEMFGAEALFMNRCVTRPVFDRCVAMINGFKEYFLRHGQVVYENPSPGNKDGGITTLEEKSLGCLQKGGTSPVVDILPYGGRLQQRGLNFLTGPGNDIVSVTALAASGAHLVLFTTGRGTPLGGPIPTFKIATNSDLATRKENWIDFNAGQLLEKETMDSLAAKLLDEVIMTASGQPARNELNGFREIAIFKDGVTL
ncbi:altronate dehydratase family protein [Opitutus sp. ER46]|uniref:UxaA family hydrolase n=1 Tax=Opitutus sp. ER46 TaxID=2161864 RepID=UPI000D3182DA|nr:altronate dehydratase family protein [Opitutus sp. ER46]PTX97892.1 altronate hydrolase [Opitutus sp. ER46]